MTRIASDQVAIVDAAHAALVSAGVLEPVSLGGADARLWLDCELASLAENRLRDHRSPIGLDDDHRTAWLATVTTERELALEHRAEIDQCYWILDGHERAGTLALARRTLGGTRLGLSSLYVLPAFRGRGVGRRSVRAVIETLARHDLGLRLATSWSWQRTVRFYLGLGAWVRSWKRELDLCWDPGTPTPCIEVDERHATLAVRSRGEKAVLATAQRRGDTLEFNRMEMGSGGDSDLGEARWFAPTTLALALAMAGWPLVRSREHWDQGHFADAGPLEALAYKIAIWEAGDRKHGFTVETPRIPNLAYPSWDDLEKAWESNVPAYDLVMARLSA